MSKVVTSLVLASLFSCGSWGEGADGGKADGGKTDGSGTGASSFCVDTINMYRATLALPPYARWTDAETCADSQAESDSMTGKAHGAFGMCGESAQNECPNWSGPPEMLLKNCLASMWAEGPGTDFTKHGHYINMSSTKYTKVACGFYQTSAGKYWAIQDFR